jgi:hypothetical protein
MPLMSALASLSVLCDSVVPGFLALTIRPYQIASAAKKSVVLGLYRSVATSGLSRHAPAIISKYQERLLWLVLALTQDAKKANTKAGLRVNSLNSHPLLLQLFHEPRSEIIVTPSPTGNSSSPPYTTYL